MCKVFLSLSLSLYIYIYGNPLGPTSAMKVIMSMSVLVLVRTDIENPVNSDRFCVGSYGLKLM